MAWIIGVSRIEIQSCRKIATNYAQNLARHRCHLHAAFSKTNSENSTKLGSTWGFQRRYHASCNQPSNIGITIKIYGISGYLIGKWCFFMELTVQNKKITISWGFKGLGQLDMGYELGPNQGFSPKMFQTPGSPTQKNNTSTQYDILITRG